MTKGWLRGLGLLALAWSGWVQPAVADVQDAIVKIYVIHNSPDYYNPWAMRGPFPATGSGAIIKGRKILTNAHVVSDETFIQVRRHGQSRKYEARVVDVAHAADLALLAVDDEAFFEGADSLELGDLPQAQDEVLVYGFPLGGDTMSLTKGVVSRIEHQVYSHSSTPFLAVQIDAAINPGNSGGPAIINGKIVGVTMQGISQADNIGYIIPPPVIRHFLADIEHGGYQGYPSLGIAMQNMENRDLKARQGLEQDTTGMLVVHVIPNSSAAGILQPGDVILTMDGYPVADDGTIEFRPRERTSVSYLVQNKQVGESIKLEIWRDHQRQTVAIPLVHRLEEDRIIPLDQYDILPTYYIFGGVVFCPLTSNLLKAWGPNWADTAPEDLVALLSRNYVEQDRDQVVMVLKVLAADINQGYHPFSNWLVEDVNGVKVRNLKHLVELLSASTNAYAVFRDKLGNQITLAHQDALAVNGDILKKYRIIADRSPDLVAPAVERSP